MSPMIKSDFQQLQVNGMEQLDISEFNLRLNQNGDDVEKTDVDINFHKLLKKEIENDIDKVSKKEYGSFKSFTIKQETCPKLDTTQEHGQSLPKLVHDECVSFKIEHQDEEICLFANIEGDIFPSYLNDALHASVHSLEEVTDISSCELFKAESISDINSYTKDDPCQLQYRLNASEQFPRVVNQLNENYSLDEGQLWNERDNCHLTGENSYKCDICNAAFAKYFSLEKHLITHCGVKPDQATSPCAQTTKEHHCDFSVGTSTKCTDLNAHQKLKTVEKYNKCNICLYEFDKKDNLGLHGRLHIKEKSHKCKICSKTFTQKSHLNRHQSVHTGERPYKCDQSSNCTAAFAAKYDLEIHKSLHSKKKPFQCHQCSAAFSLIKKLKRHLIIHSTYKPHKCNICRAAYACKSRLTSHLKTHTGEKPFNCNICSKAFATKPRLARHQITHAAEKPHQCAICLSSHATMYHLTRHQAIHWPTEEKLKLKEKLKVQEKQHKCHFCSSAFTHKTTLVHHQKLHTGERPYKCSICPASFPSKSNLGSHKKAHTGDKPYRCNICKVSYANIGRFNVHQRNHVTTS